ncbi:PAS domain-containing protein (plasmid) [Nostoc sp. UHCC 0926]|uniref:PAS domain-containing protein n=1 Tax=Nostoc sp. UHCC 0926 TaxID=3025190 RepID=UPI00235F9AA5|nr:PAS domain-containing protein [Nostoc sp. UHCC 0926]WDD36475.1 PAS domain-containing protein [Nostoc sp. UHCC 0926]
MSDFSNELHTQIQYSLIEKLSQSERRYRELVDSLREIVFKCDRLGNLNFLNRAWTNTLGYAIADVIGSALGNFIDLDDRHLWEKTLEKLQTGVEVCQQLRFYHQTGLTLPALKRRGFLNLRHNLLLQVCTNKSRGFISASVAYV